jgi:hypothetical protein
MLEEKRFNATIPISSLKQLICVSADRKSYGIKPKEAICYEDETSECLWSWEVQNMSFFPLKT